MTHPISEFEILVFRARMGGWYWRISWSGVDGQRRVYTKRIALSVVIDVLERIGITSEDARVPADERADEEELFEGLRAEQSDRLALPSTEHVDCDCSACRPWTT